MHLSKQDAIIGCYLWRKQSRQAGCAVDIGRDLRSRYGVYLSYQTESDCRSMQRRNRDLIKVVRGYYDPWYGLVFSLWYFAGLSNESRIQGMSLDACQNTGTPSTFDCVMGNKSRRSCYTCIVPLRDGCIIQYINKVPTNCNLYRYSVLQETRPTQHIDKM